MTDTDEAMIQVLGAIAYGEWRAYEGACARAEACDDAASRAAWRRVAAQELRHYKGFTRRLAALGVEPDSAMQDIRPVLDAYGTQKPSNDIERAVWDFLGEGIADDLLVWFREVVDDELAAFVETVLADEAEHEDRAAVDLRALLDANESDRALAQQAAERMVTNMLGTGGTTNGSILAFMQLGRADELLRAIMGGFARRLTEIGVDTEPVARIATAGLSGKNS